MKQLLALFGFGLICLLTAAGFFRLHGILEPMDGYACLVLLFAGGVFIGMGVNEQSHYREAHLTAPKRRA